jgi:prepilin-type N-terminal cleavage/methylation domain-containing protein
MQLDLSKAPAQTLRQRGFTIVELLIVIVVIGILAAIIIIAYNGVTQKAHASVLQSDLKNGATSLGISRTTDGTYPSDATQANGGQGLKASSGNSLSYRASSDGSSYCLIGSGYNMTYSVTNNNQTPQIGLCNDGVVTTLAGSGVAGFADGTGAAAKFYYPSGVAIDASGVVYVADQHNNCIRKVTSVGVVTTFAGTCASNGSTAGFADGTGAAAKFGGPDGIAIDPTGTLYVSDSGNNCFRKITSAGVVTTLAGTCAYNGSTSGFANGTGAAAQFNDPEDVAVDASGTVYVTDDNQCFRKITSAGVVTTLAGTCASDYSTAGFADGTGAAAKFNWAGGVAVDTSGVVYVADSKNNCIRKITSSGVVTTLAGTCASDNSTQGYADGTGAAAKFYSPSGVTVDAAGTVFVSDQGNERIRKITTAGVVSTLAGSGVNSFADGTGTAAKFYEPYSVAVDPFGTVYVADGWNQRIRIIR